jgi:hypothetical protein
MPITTREWETGKVFWWRRLLKWWRLRKIHYYIRKWSGYRTHHGQVPVTVEEYEHWFMTLEEKVMLRITGNYEFTVEKYHAIGPFTQFRKKNLAWITEMIKKRDARANKNKP